jgi:hypothetical protein
MDIDFILLNSDVLFHPKILEYLLYYYQNTTVEPWDYISFRASTTTNTLTNVTITNNEFYDAPEDVIAFKVGGVYPQIVKGVIKIENNKFIKVSV